MNRFPSKEQGRGAVAVPCSASTETHHTVLETLFYNLEFDFERVSSTIDPILTAQQRCRFTPFYIQGIVADMTAFLSTNLSSNGDLYVTRKGFQWRLGGGQACEISIPQGPLAIHQASIGFEPGGCYLMATIPDTLTLNREKLQPNRCAALRDGDLIEVGALQIEFLLDCFNP